MPCDHEKRVHEDHHQHLLVQPRRGGPGYLAVRHASGTLPYVAAVSLDPRRGTYIALSIHYEQIKMGCGGGMLANTDTAHV